MTDLRYAVVTPARNESTLLPALADALAGQTIQPQRWVVVDNGSSDATATVAATLTERYAWAELVTADADPSLARGGPVVRAFHRGVSTLPPVDVVFKVDADVTFEPDYAERVLEAFDGEPELGIASGSCWDVWSGEPRQRHVTGAHVWGAARGYRSTCLYQLLPLEERMGWDGIDLVKAHLRGWRTETLRELPFYHHRLEGDRDGSRRVAWKAQGDVAHYMGYRPSYVLLRALHRGLSEPAALTILTGYLMALARRTPRCPDLELRRFVRREQRLRNLPLRAREALGRS
jgi:glycosyltransferase involved in cell wall biosynthesis